MNISNYCTNEEPPSDSSQTLSSTFFQIIEFETIFAKGYLYPKGTYLTQHFKYLIAGNRLGVSLGCRGHPSFSLGTLRLMTSRLFPKICYAC